MPEKCLDFKLAVLVHVHAVANNVVNIQPEVPAGTYPRVTKRVGASPPQGDEEEDEDEC